MGRVRVTRRAPSAQWAGWTKARYVKSKKDEDENPKVSSHQRARRLRLLPQLKADLNITISPPSPTPHTSTIKRLTSPLALRLPKQRRNVLLVPQQPPMRLPDPKTMPWCPRNRRTPRSHRSYTTKIRAPIRPRSRRSQLRRNRLLLSSHEIKDINDHHGEWHCDGYYCDCWFANGGYGAGSVCAAGARGGWD